MGPTGTEEVGTDEIDMRENESGEGLKVRRGYTRKISSEGAGVAERKVRWCEGGERSHWIWGSTFCGRLQVQLPQRVEGLEWCEGIELDFAEGIEGGVGDELGEQSELVIGARGDAGGVGTL